MKVHPLHKLKQLIDRASINIRRRRTWVKHLRARFEVSVGFACNEAGFSRGVYYSRYKPQPDDEVIDTFFMRVELYPRWGMPIQIQ
ncbi:hypothetical protein [Pseudoalteromonas luteoviolacea]|uniref:hypothetical protein n=1 Tax=Pseudoalteromonas luteoviolacea TaxID=43657 RepID=UPI001B373B4F|nr:hypothetical protein [Pseudoalteromonas luteoviolacea]MBQ4839507.1 hypothetical protein [Pseudoalteromonas luteoviolacea]